MLTVLQSTSSATYGREHEQRGLDVAGILQPRRGSAVGGCVCIYGECEALESVDTCPDVAAQIRHAPRLCRLKYLTRLQPVGAPRTGQ